jgi:amino acid transporter
MKPRIKISSALFQFVIAIVFMGSGIFMLIRNLVVGGVYARTNQTSGFGGWFLMLFGLVFLVVAYFSLSPFSRMREFFEGNKSKGKSGRGSKNRNS